jgi:hypothetical protein
MTRQATTTIAVLTTVHGAIGLAADLPVFETSAGRLVEVVGLEAPKGFRVNLDGSTLVLEGRLPDTGQGPGAVLVMRHAIEKAKHIWIPHLAPEAGYVMGDHAFRSPAIIVADERVALAIIPELDDVGTGYRTDWRTWLDYDHPARTIRVAAGDYEVVDHVLYRSRPCGYRGQKVHLRVHVLSSDKPADVANPYGMAARWLWERYGRKGHAAGATQQAPVSRYADYIMRWAFTPEGWGETVWQEFNLDARRCGAPAFIVDVAQHPSVPKDQRKWREPLSIWNQAWFSTQRCANGLLRYAQQCKLPELAERARLMTAIALAAPQKDGLFPAVYTTKPRTGGGWYMLYKDTPGWDQGRWTNSDRRPSEASEDAYHLLDAAFTARLLLEWDTISGGDPAAVAYATRFADRLCKLQLPSGAFPGWLEPGGRVVPTLAEGPESAMGATLLLELLARDPQRVEYRQAALRALAYLEKGPVAEGRWEDYETYFSCSRWGADRIGRKVARNGVHKQNTLSHFWSAEAFLAAFNVLGEKRFLEVGRRCLDELSLFQQVWDPPFIAARCHGGFGVMNADGEWNDARQSLFAPLYLDYYRATGMAEYFERGVSALRASFAMLYCPENEQVRRQYELKHPFFGPESFGFTMENIAHGGPAPADGSAIGPFTIYTWGNGAALATAAKVRDLYGDVYVDSQRQQAFGIDGCSASIEGDRVKVVDRFGRSSLAVVHADGRREKLALTDGRGDVGLAMR